jgi:hypothetical protein
MWRREITEMVVDESVSEMVCGVEHDRFAELIQSNRVAAGQHPGRGHFG